MLEILDTIPVHISSIPKLATLKAKIQHLPAFVIPQYISSNANSLGLFLKCSLIFPETWTLSPRCHLLFHHN